MTQHITTKTASTNSPSPTATANKNPASAELAEELDAHRKRQQAKFPDLTLTDMYNILEKLRAADRPSNAGILPASPLSPQSSALSPPSSIHSAADSPHKDKLIHDHGLISILKQLHDELDTAVFNAYNWPQNLTDEQLLQNLVSLNHQRAAEEKQGKIKYLRPDFQKK